MPLKLRVVPESNFGKKLCRIRNESAISARSFCTAKTPLVHTRAKKTLANWDHLFTFLKYEGVDPTNNKAEQALRPAVQWRKICFGSQSNNGMRFTERLSTVIGTCRINGINPFHFLVEMITAGFAEEHISLTLPLSPSN
jgi:hypothetical protein